VLDVSLSGKMLSAFRREPQSDRLLALQLVRRETGKE
jgi:hypothetical protein